MYKHFKLLMVLLLINFFSSYAFGKSKILDLGEIEIIGEVRRPNINLIYSKKYMSKAMLLIAKKELKKLETELLKPAENLILKKQQKIKKKNPEKQ